LLIRAPRIFISLPFGFGASDDLRNRRFEPGRTRGAKKTAPGNLRAWHAVRVLSAPPRSSPFAENSCLCFKGPQRHKLTGAQPMAVGEQDRRGVPVAPAVALGGVNRSVQSYPLQVKSRTPAAPRRAKSPEVRKQRTGWHPSERWWCHLARW